jgi:alpha-D-xyloside xylohydrolase
VRTSLCFAVLGLGAASTVQIASCGTSSGPPSGTVEQPIVLPAQCSAPSATVAGAHSWGALTATVFASGHVVIDQPDAAGNAHALRETFDPPAALFPEGGLLASSVLSVAELAAPTDGVAVTVAMGTRHVVVHLTSPVTGVVRYEVVDWGGAAPSEATIASPSDASEHYYGFGEKFDALDQSGNDVDVITSDHPGAKGDHSYKVAPWFVSTRGYGFHLDSTAESFFHLRSLSPSCTYVTNKAGALAFNVSAGPRLTDVLTHYTSYSGRPALPPAFAFGPWLSSDVWRDGGEVRFVVETMRSLGIPGSVFVFDSPWEVAYNDFQFNMAQWGAGNRYATPVVDASGNWDGTSFSTEFYPGFASVADMMSFLRNSGYKVVLWLTPIVNVHSVAEGIAGQNTGQASTYADGIANDVFVHDAAGKPLLVDWWKGTGSPVDFTSPTAKAWFTGQLANVVSQAGGAIGGFKTDDGESHTDPTSTSDGVYIPPDAQYADGRTGVEMRNGYALEYQKAVWNVLGNDGLILARGGFAGTQAFPGGWAGDNQSTFGTDDGLPTVIVAAQSAAMSGYSMWGSDIGGYEDTGPITDPHRTAAQEATVENLFMRWTQFGALSPVMQLHRQIASNHQYAWSFGGTALGNYRTFARLHTALFPYFYSYAQTASATGIPILRPSVLMNPDDPSSYGVRYVYYVGDELLAAPIMADSPSRSITLPQGTWIDFDDGTIHAGGQAITATPGPTQMPLYVKSGSIVPMLLDAPLSLNTAAYVGPGGASTPGTGLDFRVYPAQGATARFTVYDGTSIAALESAGATTVSLTSAPRAVELHVFGAQPTTVTKDGAALPQLGAAAFAQASAGWTVQAPFVLVKFAHTGGATQIVAR